MTNFDRILRACAALTLASAMTFPASAQITDTDMPDLSGLWRCIGHESACDSSGRTFTVIQKGTDLEIKNDKGEIGSGQVTSGMTISAGPIWNMLGIIESPRATAIQWSNGTNWEKAGEAGLIKDSTLRPTGMSVGAATVDLTIPIS